MTHIRRLPPLPRPPSLAVESLAGLRVVGVRETASGFMGVESFTPVRGVTQPAAPAISQYYVKTEAGVADPSESSSNVEHAACGSASVAAMLLRFAKLANPEGVDAHLRALTPLGGSLLSGAAYLRMRGLEARQYDGGSVEELKRRIAEGYGVIITLSNQATPHTLIVTGFFTDEHGNEYVQLQDWMGHAIPVILARQDFENKWAAVCLGGYGGLDTGIHRTFTLVASKGTRLPASGTAWSTLNASSSHVLVDGVQAVLTGTGYLRQGELLGGCARLFGGLVELSAQVPAGLVQLTGASLEWCGKQLTRMSAHAFSRGGLIGKIGATLVALLGALLWLSGLATRCAGQLVGGLTGAFARGLAWPWLAASDALHADDDAYQQVRFSDPSGSAREQRNYEQLAALPSAGKLELLRALSSGAVSRDERAMMVRVLEAAEPVQRAELIKTMGTRKLAAHLRLPAPVSSSRGRRRSAADHGVMTFTLHGRRIITGEV